MNLKVELLRKIIESESLSGYIVTTKDEFDSEYPPAYLRRFEYLTDFLCSNGVAFILRDRLIFFTDTRYLLAAKESLIGFDVFNIAELRKFDWSLYIKAEDKIGYDAKILNSSFLGLFAKLNLVETSYNFVDRIWENRPPAPKSEVYHYDAQFSGESSEDKLRKVREIMKTKGFEGIFISSPESVCWLLNIRASDSEFSPIMLSCCYLDFESIILFTNERELNKNIFTIDVVVKKLDEIEIFLERQNKTISIPENSSIAIEKAIKSNKLIKAQDLILPLRAIKNQAEINGAKKAHIEDAIAMVEFFAWFADYKDAINEYELGLKISEFRAKSHRYLMDSFSPICAYQGNGAKIHYRAAKTSSAKITGEGLLLIDSGGHYFGGTTDITRTIAVGGKILSEYQEYYTKILRGHIALAKIKFPKILTGCNLDVLARQYLWADYEDYGHGTGHGVGNALSVHEGPMRISLYDKEVVLKEGMIISNEPGFYQESEFGIRIENLQYIKESKNNSNFLEFEQLTMVPYSKELILLDKMAEDEIFYLKEYYHQIYSILRDKLTKKAEKYLISQLSI